MAKKAKKPSMSARAKNVGSSVAKASKNVGHKVADTGKKVGTAVGHGAVAAKDKTFAAFGSLKQKIKGKDEEE